MNSASTYIAPVVLALAVHALVVAALLVHWQGKTPFKTIQNEPYYIEAALVQHNPYTERDRKAADAAAREKARRLKALKEKREAAERAQAQKDAAAKRQQAARQKKIADEQAALEKKQKELARQLADAQAEDVGADRTPAQEAERKKMEQGLAQAIMDEQQRRLAITDDEKAMAYVQQIKREIVQNWSRPPSARNGMQALLKVHLVPTGEVVDVTVVQSSGNDAFDRSAILAVQKAQRFEVPSDSRQFERNFREFEVLFRPEDLRL